MVKNNDSGDSINTTTTTIIQEDVRIGVRPRRSSIFKPNVVELKNEDDENATDEYYDKVMTEFQNWRQHYVDIKRNFLEIKNIYSKSIQPIRGCSEDFQEFLLKAENYVENANEFFDQINVISTMNENSIKLKQKSTFKLELQINTMKENIRDCINNNE